MKKKKKYYLVGFIGQIDNGKTLYQAQTIISKEQPSFKDLTEMALKANPNLKEAVIISLCKINKKKWLKE